MSGAARLRAWRLTIFQARRAPDEVRPAAAIPPGRITEAEGRRLAKKPNYDFEKRRKELERKQKKDAKRDERLQRRRAGGPDDGDLPADEGAEVPADADTVPPRS